MPTTSHFIPEIALWEPAGKSLPKVLSGIRGLLIALLAAAVGTDLRYVLDPFLGNRCAFLISTLAVMAAAILGGFTAGFLTVVLSAAADAFLFVQPRFNLSGSFSKDQNEIGLFLVAGLCLAILGSRLRNRKARNNTVEFNELEEDEG